LNDKQIKKVLFICTYKNEKENGNFKEVIPLFKNNYNYIEINLSNLSENETISWLSDIFKINSQKIIKLSQIVYNSTKGNPLSIIQYIKMLYSEKLIFLEDNKWNLKIKKIIEKDYHGSNILKHLLDPLNEEIKHILFICSTFGTYIKFRVLELILDIEKKKIIEKLKFALDLDFKIIYIFQKKLFFIHDEIKNYFNNIYENEKKNKIEFEI